tara:strand:- start:783 stop:1517 length:735 start_codon:yes stop_codon:yes gene_type:complete
MAISSSGSVSFSQIQSEWGGSNPISMSEYYSGSLANNTSTITITPTVQSVSSSYTSGKSTYQQYADGWGHTSVTPKALSSSTQSLTLSYTTGIDKTGNAGAIPSSGAIQANHFRGTNGTGTSNSIVCLGVVNYRDTGGTFQNVGYVFFQGHIGTAFNPYGGGTIGATGGPFVRVVTSAKGNYGSTSIYQNTTTNTSNGWFNGKFAVFHTSNSTVGNYTTMSFFSSATQSMGGLSGTWSQTFYLS